MVVLLREPFQEGNSSVAELLDVGSTTKEAKRLSVITSMITGRRQVILHFKTPGIRGSVCIMLLSSDWMQFEVEYSC